MEFIIATMLAISFVLLCLSIDSGIRTFRYYRKTHGDTFRAYLKRDGIFKYFMLLIPTVLLFVVSTIFAVRIYS